MADTGYGLSPTSYNSYASWLNQRRAAGRPVQPWEYTAMLEADLKAQGARRDKLAALDIEKQNSDRMMTWRENSTQQQADLEREKMGKASITGGISGITNTLGSAALYDTMSGGKLSNTVKGWFGSKPASTGNLNTPTTPPTDGVFGPPVTVNLPSTTPTTPQNFTPGFTADTTASTGTAPFANPQSYLKSMEAFDYGTFDPMAGGGGFTQAETMATLPKNADFLTDVTRATMDATNPAISGADILSGTVAAAPVIPVAQGAEEAMIAAGNLAEGGAGGLGGATAGVDLVPGIGGLVRAGMGIATGEDPLKAVVHGAGAAGGAIGGAMAGQALIPIPGVGAAIGAIIGGLGGDQIMGFMDDCIIVTACHGRDSQEVAITRKFRDTYMTPTQIRGYYMMAEKVAPLMAALPCIKDAVKEDTVDHLVSVMGYGLGFSHEKPTDTSRRVMSRFLMECTRLGKTVPSYTRRATGEVY